MKTTLISRFALFTFLAAGYAVGDTTFHSDLGTIVGDGVGAGTLFGTPYTAAAMSGTTAYFFRGDLRIPPDAVLTAQGSRPVRIIVGGDLDMNSVTISVSAAATPGPGGGWGGQGGAGGGGATRGSDSGINNNTPPGGVGGTPVFCVFANGGDGHYGFTGSYANNFNLVQSGGSSAPGSQGSLGFGQSSGAGTGGSNVPGGSGGSNGFAGGGGSGGSGGAGNYGFGAPGSAGLNGGAGGPGTPGSQGWAGNSGGPAIFNAMSGYDLFAGSGGGGGAGGGGGGAGGNGGIGGTGGGGGGGGATSCVSGGHGGSGGFGGWGSGGGWGGSGAPGSSGGHGAGAIEFASLGRLIYSGNAYAIGGNASPPQSSGSPGQFAYGGSSGANGYAGEIVGGSAGRGGNGGTGGWGGTGGRGGNGGGGGFGGGGGGGTIKFNAAELALGATFSLLGGADSPGYERAFPGALHLAYNHSPVLNYSLTSGGSHGSGYILSSPGPADPNPYFAPAANTSCIAGLEGGGAIAGIVPNLRAEQIVDPNTLPANCVAAVVLVDTVPGILGPSPASPAVVLVNLGQRPLSAPAFGLGAASFTTTLQRFGWANDPRFGGTGPQPIITLQPGQVYLTMIPPGSSINTATLSGTYAGSSRLVSRSDFGSASPLTLIVPPCSPDLNDDDVVDDADFVVFAAQYERFVVDPGDPGDFNADGFVDDSDFVVFAAAYESFLCP